MNSRVTVDQETQTIFEGVQMGAHVGAPQQVDTPQWVGAPQRVGETVQVYVSGENVPQVATGPEGPARPAATRAVEVRRIASTEARAFEAAQALRDWTRHNQECLMERRAPDARFVKDCIGRVVCEHEGEDGVTAWVRLDCDRPSERTVREYRGTARDLLLYLAMRGISPAECSPDDMKAFKAFLQSEGAPVKLELMRAAWYGREPRNRYMNDWRGLAGLAACRGYGATSLDLAATRKALGKATKRTAAGLGRLAEQAEQAAMHWRASLTNIMATYASQPRQPMTERYTSDTVSLRITLARNFFKMAMSRQAASDVNPLLEIKAGKSGTGRSQKIISRFFSDDEVLAVLQARDEMCFHTPRDKAAAARDTAMIRLARNQGLRVSEIEKLDMADFNPAAGDCGTLEIRHAKGDKFRTVFLTEKTRASLERWLQYRGLLNPMTGAVFVTLNRGERPGMKRPGQRISDRAIREMFDEAQKEVGIKQPGRSVHGLRHSYATRAMMEDEGQLISLSLSMGHSTPTITMGYVEAAQLIKKNPAKLAEI